MIIYEFEIAVLNHILVQVDNSPLNELTVFSTKNGNSQITVLCGRECRLIEVQLKLTDCNTRTGVRVTIVARLSAVPDKEKTINRHSPGLIAIDNLGVNP